MFITYIKYTFNVLNFYKGILLLKDDITGDVLSLYKVLSRVVGEARDDYSLEPVPSS